MKRLTLLCALSSDESLQGPVNLSGDDPFKASTNIPICFSFPGSALDTGLSLEILAHSDARADVQGLIELSVAVAV